MTKGIMNFNLPKEESSIIKVIGVGGGGSNAVNHMYRQGIRGVDFVVCNTDQQALDMSPVPKKIALGSSLTEGRGAGAKAEVGRNAAIETLDEIKEVLGNNTKMVFITAGMGGGTGTGAAPVIAEAAREMGILTVGIVTVPFAFEGKKRKVQADLGLDELKKHVDTVLVICNDKLREMYGNLKLGEAFNQADDILTIAAKGIAEIITVEGYVNVDFEDVRTVMTNSGVAIMGSATASGANRATEAVTRALASPLLNDNNIFGASNILLYISSGSDEVTMDEVTEITDFIQEEAGMTADIIWGNGYDEALGDTINVTVIATGFTNEKTHEIQGRENRVVHQLTENKAVQPTSAAPTHVAPVANVSAATAATEFTARPVLLNKGLQNLSNDTVAQSNLFETKQDDTKVVYQLEDTIVVEQVKVEAPTFFDTVTELKQDFINEVNDADQFVVNETLEEEVFIAQQEEVTVDEVIDEDIVMEAEEEVEEEQTFFAEEKATEFEFELPKLTPLFETEQKVTFNLYDEEELPKRAEPAMDAENGPTLVTRAANVEADRNAISMEDAERMNAERLARLRMTNAKFREPRNLVELEQEPAYKRRNVSLAEVPHSSESTVSRYSVGETEDENGNKRTGLSGNSFLHETVD
jgi:cell division protein FtsZ